VISRRRGSTMLMASLFSEAHAGTVVDFFLAWGVGQKSITNRREMRSTGQSKAYHKGTIGHAVERAGMSDPATVSCSYLYRRSPHANVPRTPTHHSELAARLP
jgi:hypothetical protein